MSYKHHLTVTTKQIEYKERDSCDEKMCGTKSWSSAPVLSDRHFFMFSASSNRHIDASENINPAADFYQRKKDQLDQLNRKAPCCM